MIENLIEEQKNAFFPAEAFIQKADSYHECSVIHVIIIDFSHIVILFH